MAPKAEACAECTQNCLLMHKKEKNPSPVATTFFKVMFGEESSKLLYLPPRFAHSVQRKVGKATWLEDSNGEKWEVKFTEIDGVLAFEEGWGRFWSAHGLKVGDFLVFHYIMESHFVVLMYGESGCPEIRHFGFTRHKMKGTRKEDKLTVVDQIPSNVNTNGHHHEIVDTVDSQQKETRIKKNKPDDMIPIPPNVSTSNTHNHLVASPARSQPIDSDKETSQRSKPLVNTSPDNTVCETPLNHNKTIHVEDEELRGKSLHDLSIPKISPGKLSGSRKNDVVAGGGGDETKIKESGKALETPSKEMTEKPKEIIYKNTIKKRLRSTMFPMTPKKIVKKEPVLTSQTDGGASPSTEIFHKPIVTPTKTIKKELISTSKHDTSGSKLHNVGVPSLPPSQTFLNPKAKPIEMPKNNPTANPRLHDSLMEENTVNLPIVKPEPVDYDETPSAGATNTLFSAVMSSYQYLVLPKWVKLKSNVILLRNKGELWPVLYQKKVGLKALTQSWEVFARQRGIQPGDNCEFVLETEASNSYTCSVFTVHVTRK